MAAGARQRIDAVNLDSPDVHGQLAGMELLGLRDSLFKAPLDKAKVDDVKTRQWALKMRDFLSSKTSVSELYDNSGLVAPIDGGAYLKHLEELTINPVTGERSHYMSPGQYLQVLRRNLRECGLREEELAKLASMQTDVKARQAPERVLEGIPIMTGGIGIGVAHKIDIGKFKIPPKKLAIEESSIPRQVSRLFDAAVMVAVDYYTMRSDFPQAKKKEFAAYCQSLQDKDAVGALVATARDEHALADLRAALTVDGPGAGKALIAYADPFRKYIEGIKRNMESRMNELCVGEASRDDFGMIAVGDTALNTISNVAARVCYRMENDEWALGDTIKEALDPLNAKLEKARHTPQVRDLVLNLIGTISAVEDGIMHKLTGSSTGKALTQYIASLPHGTVVVARDLGPLMDTTAFENKLAGVAFSEGSPTMHVLINFRKGGVPTVIQTGNEWMDSMRTGDTIIVVDERTRVHDGRRVIDLNNPNAMGMVVVNPDPDTIDYWTAIMEDLERRQDAVPRDTHKPATTLDGRRIKILANIDSPDDIYTRIEGSAVLGGKEYTFSASSGIDMVRRVDESAEGRTEIDLFSGDDSTPLPKGVTLDETDRQMISWVRFLDVDRYQDIARDAGKRGVIIRYSKRVRGAVGYGAEGIGLNRWEAWAKSNDKLPSPEEFEEGVYRQALAIERAWVRETRRSLDKYSAANSGDAGGVSHLKERIRGPFVDRCLDFSNDKPPNEEWAADLDGFGSKELEDPFWQAGTEFLLRGRNVERLTKPWIKGLMRAASEARRQFGDDADRQRSIMLPMITKAKQVEDFHGLMVEASHELGQTAHAEPDAFDLVPMIEDPKIANTDYLGKMFRRLKGKSRKVSIGTNDLLDRVKNRARRRKDKGQKDQQWDYFDPVNLAAVRQIVKAAENEKWKKCVCGEEGARRRAVPINVGSGVDELSMSGISMPLVKRVIRGLSAKDLEAKANEITEAAQESPEKAFKMSIAITEKVG